MVQTAAKEQANGNSGQVQLNAPGSQQQQLAGQRQATNEQAQAQAELMQHPMAMVQNQQGKFELSCRVSLNVC